MVECEQTQKSPHLHWMALLQIMNSNVCINLIQKNDKKNRHNSQKNYQIKTSGKNFLSLPLKEYKFNLSNNNNAQGTRQ